MRCTLTHGLLLASTPSQAGTPIAFERNDGQADPAARFLTRASGQITFLTDERGFPCAKWDPAAAIDVTSKFLG